MLQDIRASRASLIDGGAFLPRPTRTTPDAVTGEVLDLVERRFAHHPGALRPFWFAVTADQATLAMDLRRAFAVGFVFSRRARGPVAVFIADMTLIDRLETSRIIESSPSFVIPAKARIHAPVWAPFEAQLDACRR